LIEKEKESENGKTEKEETQTNNFFNNGAIEKIC
jgi:hypothetical protein